MGWADAIQNRFQYYSDKLKPQFRYRWIATSVLACFYAIRVYLYGCLLITFFLLMTLTTLLSESLFSYIDPDNPDRVSPPLLSDAPPPLLLPIKASDEFRPFRPVLSEFEFWRAVNVVLCVALCITFIPIKTIFTGWLCWFIYIGIWLTFTIHILIEQREFIIEHKYIPFYYGDKKRGEYKGK